MENKKEEPLTTLSEGESEMSFWQHLEELRSTIIGCVAAFGIAGALSLIFSREIFALLRWPLENAPHVPADAGQALIVMRFMDTFSILLYIALLGGIVLSGPLILFRIGKFVTPALSARERARLVPFCLASSGLFVAGATLAFFWIAPLSIGLPYMLAEHFGLQMNWLADDYYKFVVILTLFSGLMFEIPVVVTFLQYLEIVSKETLLRRWRWVLSGILVAVLLVSPIGDPVALLVFSGALFALYLCSIFVGDFLLQKKLRRENAD